MLEWHFVAKGEKRITFVRPESGDALFKVFDWNPFGEVQRRGPFELNSAQRSRAESCAMVRPREMRGSQLIGLSRVARHRGQ